MVTQGVPSRSIDPARAVLGMAAALHIGAVVLSERFEMLPAVLIAYAAAWWVVRKGGA